MKRIILTNLFLIFTINVFAQVYNTAPGVYIGPTGFVDNFTNATTWQDSAYFWTTDNPGMYALSQTGNGKLTIGVTAAAPSYQSFAAYAVNDTYDPIDISAAANDKVTLTITNTSTTTEANVRIILMGVFNDDTIDINSSTGPNSGGYGTWFKISPPLAFSETRTVTFDFSTPYMEHTASDNTRFPDNPCTAASPTYQAASSTCVTPVQIDSIIGFRMWVNAGANPNLSQWPNYDTYTGTITIDKLVIGSDPSLTSVLSPENYLGTSKVFPNPAAGKTDVGFTLKNSGTVKIDVRDSRGMHMMDVANEFLSTGDHEISVNTASLENGIYHLAFQFQDGSVHVEKLVVLK